MGACCGPFDAALVGVVAVGAGLVPAGGLDLDTTPGGGVGILTSETRLQGAGLPTFRSTGGGPRVRGRVRGGHAPALPAPV
ncbi:hypothetical protein Ae331Ps2_6363 [Pseudonocardia sp. Ae331_Ps2]|nr:hypothetical protein Ae331Ps2_6363 [Pseudonocardia sp. Ae331_Ps2]